LEILAISGMEASTQLNGVNEISKSIGIVGNYDEMGLGKLYRDKLSPDADPVVHMSVSKAEKRLKKLERDYQHTYENYNEIRVSISIYNRTMSTCTVFKSLYIIIMNFLGSQTGIGSTLKQSILRIAVDRLETVSNITTICESNCRIILTN